MRKPILVPIDFRPHSDAAFEHAERLASEANTTLIALHVSNMPDMPWSTRCGMSFHEELRAQLALVTSSIAPVKRIFAVADAGPEICRLARELDCSMIVMGVTNKCHADELLCGSVHEYVERNAPCPLVTLRVQPERSAVANG